MHSHVVYTVYVISYIRAYAVDFNPSIKQNRLSLSWMCQVYKTFLMKFAGLQLEKNLW